MLNYLHDRGFDPRQALSGEQIVLPSSLHSLILSRIDQLVESQRTLLKVASVIGRLFRVAVIWGVQQSADRTNFERDLSGLIAQDLIIPEAPEPELAYLFRHVVTQEVAYESLPFATRAALHERIGIFIEQSNADRMDQAIDLLAFHYDRSNNSAKRLRYLLRAGEVAQAEFANLAAIDYFRRALLLLDARAPERSDVLLRLGGVLELVGRRDEAAECYDEALTLAEDRDEALTLARCRMAIGELARKGGQYDAASRQLISARDGFAALYDRANLAQAINLLGTLAAQQGDFAVAEQLYAESLGIRRELADLNGVSNALNNLGILARYRGDYQRARELQEESLAMRRLSGNRWGIAASLSNLGNVLTDLGELAEARERLEEALLIAREIGDRWQIANFLNNLANVARDLGDYQVAAATYAESMSISHELNDRWSLAYVLEDTAVLWALRGDGRRTLTLVGVAAILRERINAPLSAVEQAKLDRRIEPVRVLLSELEQARAFGNGLLLALEDAIELARDAQAVGS
ncbi:MAG: tetratricopeptide repeat protein [Oscillochloris sp.]|nr:tetratricopeptide repeat protein [Oscillochloris sp.]